MIIEQFIEMGFIPSKNIAFQIEEIVNNYGITIYEYREYKNGIPFHFYFERLEFSNRNEMYDYLESIHGEIIFTNSTEEAIYMTI